MTDIEHLDDLMRGVYEIEDAFAQLGVGEADRRPCAMVLMGMRQGASHYPGDVAKQFHAKKLTEGHQVMARDQLSKTTTLAGEVLEAAAKWCANEATDAFLRSRLKRGHRIVRDFLENLPDCTTVRHQVLSPHQKWEDLDRTVMHLDSSDLSMLMQAWDRFPAAFRPAL